MISLFRKIRQKLLAENRVTRYLVYALGEIVLVMIGILLALQVNNWNEERKNNIKMAEYKKGLIEDYNRDIARIDTILILFNQSEAQHRNFTERLSHPQASFDTLVKIAKYEFLGYFSNIDAFNTATFQTLISTGDISLFPKKIRRKLIEINNQQQTVLLITQENIQQYLNALIQYKYLTNLPFSVINSGALYEFSWAQADKNELIKDFATVTLRHNNINRISKKSYQDLRKQLVEALDELRE